MGRSVWRCAATWRGLGSSPIIAWKDGASIASWTTSLLCKRNCSANRQRTAASATEIEPIPSFRSKHRPQLSLAAVVTTSFSESPSFLLTSESVTEGHPDKVWDEVSDSVLG